MLIAHISDFHIVEPGQKACGVVATSERLEQLVTCINALEPLPDVVLVTGDLTHDGRAAQVAEAKRLLVRLKMPWYIVPGNHDQRATLRDAFADRACPSGNDEFLQYVVEGYDTRFIGLDSTIPGAAGGAFCDKRAAWLEARLLEAPDKPTHLFLHHPPVKFGVPETDEDGFIGADLLAAIVDRFPTIERIHCGHIHLNACTLWQGTLVNTAPSGTGMELTLDLTRRKPSGFYIVNPAFLLHYRTTDGAMVTHRVEVRDNPSPNSF